MNPRILPYLAAIAFISAPVVMGVAETKTEAKPEVKVEAKTEAKAEAGVEAKVAAPKRNGECLASQEIIEDLEAREKKLLERETALKEKEKELQAQAVAIKEELSKLEAKKGDDQVARQKAVAAREEQVNKLMETFEGMSPKAAAQVLAGVEEELAVMALSRLTSVKAGKVLSNLKAEKSARLSELMAYGRTSNRKEGARADTGK
jgi:flagellar motility protein MotE (MotC chaperone)